MFVNYIINFIIYSFLLGASDAMQMAHYKLTIIIINHYYYFNIINNVIILEQQ